jgi:glycosyltransferase involved in cell wall biosynthesis
MLPARMLWDKGIAEFVEAARILLKRGATARFVLVGMIDKENSSAIPESRIRAWQKEGLVEWWGHREDMPTVLAAANVVVLPSYREGLPKVLLEAAASGRATVATDVPGCREVVRNGVNGLLIPPRDPVALADAIEGFVENPELRRTAGRRGRQIAEQEFSLARIAGETIAVYRNLLGESSRWMSARRVSETRA